MSDEINNQVNQLDQALEAATSSIETCPRCGAILLPDVINGIPVWVCPTEGCGYKRLRRI